MGNIICQGCQLHIEPIKVFERDLKTKKWWSITKCPRERCGFNVDLVECDKPAPKGPRALLSPRKPEIEDDKNASGWRFGL